MSGVRPHPDYSPGLWTERGPSCCFKPLLEHCTVAGPRIPAQACPWTWRAGQDFLVVALCFSAVLWVPSRPPLSARSTSPPFRLGPQDLTWAQLVGSLIRGGNSQPLCVGSITDLYTGLKFMLSTELLGLLRAGTPDQDQPHVKGPWDVRALRSRLTRVGSSHTRAASCIGVFPLTLGPEASFARGGCKSSLPEPCRGWG